MIFLSFLSFQIFIPISRRSFDYYSFLFLSHCITFPVFVLYFFPCIFCNVPRLSPYSFFLLSFFIFFIAYDVSLKTMIRTVQNIHLPKDGYIYWKDISCMMAQRKESIYVDMAARKTVKITLRILRIM